MKKEMSSFDVRSIVNEMMSLKGAHMDKIFQWGPNVLFRINVQGQGKRDIFFKDGRWLYLPGNKPETPMAPQSFATFLRKYLDNARIGDTVQTGFDRVVSMEVLKADHDYRIIFEMFGGGNVLLVEDGKIVNCLIHRTMKDRSVRPGEDYIMPKPRFDPTSSPFIEFTEIVKASGSDTVRTLATGINLGGQYAEEVCARAGIDKGTKTSELSDDSIQLLYECMKGVVSELTDGTGAILYRSDDGIVDISPIEMTVYNRLRSERYDTVSKAIDRLMTETAETEELGYVDPEVLKLRKRIEKQTDTVEQYLESAEDYRTKADAVYTNYGRIAELLTVLSQQSQRLTWEKLTEGAMKIPFVDSIEPQKNSVIASFDNTKIPLDYTKNIDANASDLYGKGKEMGEKAGRAQAALEESIEVLKRKEAGMERTKVAMANRAQPTKQYWFDRYKWFIAPSGRMVIAGKDAHTNDNIVKKHLKDDDVYVHADLHGAPSTILKKGLDAPNEDLREACNYALAQSKAWVAALTDGSAYWVYTDQVSKTPQAGEFVPRGAFIIRGKRNYEYHLPIRLAVGEIIFEGNRKVMCAPLDSMKALSKKYFVIGPGRGKAGRTAAVMAKELQVPEEEVSRILPPGDSEIISKVWPEENPQPGV